MRSDNISEILNHLQDAWLVSPDLRLGQLLNILTTDGPGTGLMSDDELLGRLLRWNEWYDASSGQLEPHQGQQSGPLRSRQAP